MNIFTKFSGAVATLALAAVVAVPSASALTAADIQLLVSLGVIPADKAATALALVGGNAQTNDSCAYPFTRSLTIGSTGSDVVALQTYLETKGFLTIPVGVSKGYFGPLTRGALASYQAAVGISPAVGYFGPITQAQIKNSCVVVVPVPGDDDDDDDDLRGGEASLTDYDRLSTYNNEDIEEGDTEKVFAAEFEVEDGDAKIERIDVRFEAVSETNEDEPWRQFEEVALYINGDKVAEKDADDEDDWSRESSTESPSDSRAYELRFTGLDEIIRENDEALVEIEVTTQDNIDDNDLSQTWKVWIPTDGIRARDGEGIQQYTGSNSETTRFTIEVADDGDVTIHESDDDQDATILVVDEDDDEGPYEVFRFEIDNEDADIFLNTLTIVASTSDNDIEDVISELTVEIDGEEFNYDSASTTAGVGEYLFDFEDNDDEIPVDEDETVEVVVYAEFNDQGGNYVEGTTVQFGIGKIGGSNYGSVGLTAEGQQTGDDSDVSGRQESAIHTLRTEGVVISSNGTSAMVDDADFSGDVEKGIFEIEITLQALESDMYIPDSVASSTTDANAGFVFGITQSGQTFTGNVVSYISEDTAKTEVNNRHKINEGSSARFTIRVELDPTGASSGNAYGIELQTVRFANTSTGSLNDYTVPNESQFETKKVTID